MCEKWAVAAGISYIETSKTLIKTYVYDHHSAPWGWGGGGGGGGLG